MTSTHDFIMITFKKKKKKKENIAKIKLKEAGSNFRTNCQLKHMCGT